MTEQQLAYARAEQQRLDARETYQFWSHFNWNQKYLNELAEESRRRNLEQVAAGTGQPNWNAETSALMSVDSLSPAHDDGVVWRSPSGEAGSWHPEETEAGGSVSWRSPSESGPLTSSSDAVSPSPVTWAEPEASAGVAAPTRPVERSDPSLSLLLQPIQAGQPPPEVANPVPTLQICADPRMSVLLPRDPAMAERQIQDLDLLSRLVAEAVRSGAAGDRDRETAHREAAVQVYSFWSQFYRDQDRLQRLCERMHELSQEAIRRAEELRLLQVESDKINADSVSPFVDVRDAIDMRAYERPGVAHNRPGGFPRDRIAFWKELLARRPEQFSDENRALIARNWAPEVDEQWLDFHDDQQAYIGDRLVHHHWDRGPWAVPLPEQCHKHFSDVLHDDR